MEFRIQNGGFVAGTAKLQLYIDDDAVEIIERRTSARGKGDFVSQAIREYDQRLTLDDSDQDCGTLEQLVSLVKRLEQRVMIMDSRRFVRSDSSTA
jgi:hypothetical protein